MINFNGKLLPEDSSFLNHSNRGFKYGDALFETMRATSGLVFFMEEHYLRLMASMRILRMEIPMNFTMEYIEDQIKACLLANQLVNTPARIRFTVFRNDGGLYLPKNNEVSFVVEAQQLNSSFYLIEDTPYEVELFKDFYINADMLSTLKTNNKIINVVGSIYAKENGYDNCLLLNQSKQVVEALNANLFLCSGKTIKTPPLKDGCLNGIIRKQLMRIIEEDTTYTLEEKSISPFELQKANELFLTNTIVGIRPVSKYRKAEYGSSAANYFLEKLNNRVKEIAN
ncbi:aminotransferase class IV [Muriicola sp. Z0-33]|uniref:aminotransferase class IV n=1 Tax=Muriicola sp. Z0-33 TaxID=2816957 RepID=UPI0022373AF6|nr:aminotransferase class IV [Muriicola sp. Z0-33]MCW5515542.1 aminotransferase class IV family protein [Muriicola sp. Z0-33]